MMICKYLLIMLCGFLLAVSAPLYAQDTPDPELLKDKGNILYQNKNIDGAIELWEEAIMADSTYSFAYNNIGVALYDKKDFAGSVDYLTKAVELDSTYEKAYNSLGNAYLALGEYEQAKENYAKTIELNPGEEGKHNNLGNALLALGDIDSALVSYEKAVDINNNYAHALNNIGVIHKRKGDREKANEFFWKAVKVDSQLDQAYANLGMMQYEEGDTNLPQALEYFKKALDLNGDSAMNCYNYALALMKNGDITQAFVQVKKASQLAPNDPDVMYLLGLTYAERKMNTQAIQRFENILEFDPEYDNARIAIDITQRRIDAAEQ